MSYLPPTSDFGSLLSVIRDPETFEKRLNELNNTMSELQKTTEENRLVAEQIANDKRRYEELLIEVRQRQSDLDQNTKQFDSFVDSKTNELNARDGEVTSRENSLSRRLDEYAQRSNELNKHKLELDQTDKQMNAREANVLDRERLVSTKEELHQSRIRQLQEIING